MPYCSLVDIKRMTMSVRMHVTCHACRILEPRKWVVLPFSMNLRGQYVPCLHLRGLLAASTHRNFYTPMVVLLCKGSISDQGKSYITSQAARVARTLCWKWMPQLVRKGR